MNINETSIEQNLIDLLKKQGYRYIHGTKLKRNLDSVILEEELKNSLKRLNPLLPKLLSGEVRDEI